MFTKQVIQMLLQKYSTSTTSIFSFHFKTVLATSFSTYSKLHKQMDNFNKINHKSYKEAINTLNNLQSNASVLRNSIRTHDVNNTTIKSTEMYLQRIGISLDKLEKLSVIHVSGSKGKGSTCALTESILRSFGVNTGFFSSPHLVYVNERIQLNGKPISDEDFSIYFWELYNLLNHSKENAFDMPAYFSFLTILSFYIFLIKNVDVAIIEVGIGGTHDCTNVVRNTRTVGITSLALEHTKLLGNTLESIADQKAGIIKMNSNVFTVLQSTECLPIIKERALEKNAKLHIVPNFDIYNWNNRIPTLSIDTSVQKLNASLAIQISYDWLKRNIKLNYNNQNFLTNLVTNYKDKMCLNVCDEVINGLEKCVWPGRCQFINFNNKRLFIDGAHTIESIEICAEWFHTMTKNSDRKKFLIFNVTGDRDSEKMLDILNERLSFNMALFTPNISSIESNTNDNSNYNVMQEHHRVCHKHFDHWNTLKLLNNKIKRNGIIKNGLNGINDDNINSTKHNNYCNGNLSENNLNSHSKVFNCVVDIFNYFDMQFKSSEEIDILVTGSLHLIGATLQTLDNFNKLP